jgi:SAM-dependent methyltransferase
MKPEDANPSKDARRLYGDLAWTWPIISPKERYVEESEEFVELVRRNSGVEAKTLLNLGCGGGNNDWTLKRHFALTGIDVSEEMLRLARDLNPEVEYREGDMRTLRLGRTFDAVVTFDSIDYMTTEADLRAAFETAWVHLKPGGVFVTYVEAEKSRFRQNRTSVLQGSLGDVEVTFVENDYDPDPTDTSFESTFVFLIRRRGDLEIQLDRHRVGLFDLETWLRLLGEVGFEVKVVPGTCEDFKKEAIPTLVCLRAGGPVPL